MRPEIEFLYSEDCPSHGDALARLQQALHEAGLEPSSIRIVRVDTMQDALRHGFPGSPTIRIDQRDIDPAGGEDAPGLACRAYRHEDGRITALPPLSLIRRALQAAIAVHIHHPPGGHSP